MKKNSLILWLMGILILMNLPGQGLNAEWVPMPGNINHLSSYMNYHHSNPEENLIYYLNEILLMEEKPDLSDFLGNPSLEANYFKTSRGMRKYWKAKRQSEKMAMKELFASRFNYIWEAHIQIKKQISHINRLKLGIKEGNSKKSKKNKKNKANVFSDQVSLELNSVGAVLEARKLLKLTGLDLNITKENKYQVTDYEEAPGENLNHYYKIAGIDPFQLQEQLNKTNRLDLKISECKVELPWSLDFFRDVTENYHMTRDELAADIVANSKMQLLIGILYRLSDREIDFISRSMQGKNAWARMYKSHRLLNGMFLISHALRVNDNHLQLPGGPDTAGFWRTLSEGNPKTAPIDFLEKLCHRHEGKLAWFYVLGSFLPEDSQKMIFRGFDHKKFRPIYDRIRLTKSEKILKTNRPELRSFSFFHLMYALQTENGGVVFPGGVEAWAKAVEAKGHTLQSLLEHLARLSREENGLKPFISVYAKFFDRPGLMTEEVIRSLYTNYVDYNVLVDFVETIPVKKPETVIKMITWAKNLDKMPLSTKEKTARIAVAQSLAALIAECAGNAMENRRWDEDYDDLMESLMQIPLTSDSADAYDGIFRFLEEKLAIKMDPSTADESFLDFMVTGVRDQLVTVKHQEYILKAPEMIKKEIRSILEKQQVTPFSELVRINRLLENYRTYPDNGQAGPRLIEAFDALHHPEMEKTMRPEVLKLLRKYSDSRLIKQLNCLVEKKQKNAPQKEIVAIINTIKNSCLLYELKNYLVTSVYAVIAKDASLRIFLNPNFTRLHCFNTANDLTPWNHSRTARRFDQVPLYHLEGGLSRLNITLAAPIGECVMKTSIGYYPTQMAPIIYNHMDLYPHPSLYNAQEYCSLLIRFGNEMLQKAEQNPKLEKSVTEKLARITAGVNYRNVVGKLDESKKSQRQISGDESGETIDWKLDYGLNISEKLRLGEALVKDRRLWDEFSQKDRLEELNGTFVHRGVERRMHRLGSVYYHTFGRLKPHRFRMFPQPLSHLFAEKWAGSEMIDELKVKMAYLSQEKGFPPQLLGCLAFRFLRMLHGFFLPGFLNDYHKTYFLYDTYNYLQLNHLYKKLKKEGALIIK